MPHEFVCRRCGRAFFLSDEALAPYPDWRPEVCLRCKRTPGPAAAAPRRTEHRANAIHRFSKSRAKPASPEEVLELHHDGPDTGVFTDGSAEPNPGPGGWASVYVVNGQIIAQAGGAEAQSTNNRMELAALIAGYRLVPSGEPAIVYSDSLLCVNTIKLWAPGWEKNGWKKKGGAIKNLELVKELYALSQTRPDIDPRWIKAHSGYRWNEYVDALANRERVEAGNG